MWHFLTSKNFLQLPHKHFNSTMELLPYGAHQNASSSLQSALSLSPSKGSSDTQSSFFPGPMAHSHRDQLCWPVTTAATTSSSKPPQAGKAGHSRANSKRWLLSPARPNIGRQHVTKSSRGFHSGHVSAEESEDAWRTFPTWDRPFHQHHCHKARSRIVPSPALHPVYPPLLTNFCLDFPV